MEEYIEYIKWITRRIYENEIEKLEKEPTILFQDSLELSQTKDEVIFVLDSYSEQDSIEKIYKYSSEISKTYKVMDISIFKGNDQKNLSKTFLITFFCILKEQYINENEKYEKIFHKQLLDLKKMLNEITKILKIENENLINSNNLKRNSQMKNINNLYKKKIREVYRYNNNIQKILKQQPKEKKLNQYKFDSYNDLCNSNVEYMDKIIQKLNQRVIRCWKKCENKEKYVKKKYALKNTTRPIAIINVQNSKELIDICKELKMDIIEVNSCATNSSHLVASELSLALKIIKNRKFVYFIDEESKKINSSNCLIINVKEIIPMSKELILEKILEDFENLYLFANMDNNNSIKVLTGTFLNFNGTDYYSGGAERYLLDLYEVCKILGYKLRIYQKANLDFIRFYNNIEVVGISDDCKNYDYEWEQDKKILNKYKNIASCNTKLNIYSSFFECHGMAIKPSIGISHGVAWDFKSNEYKPNNKLTIINQKSWIIEAAKSCDKLVSVDNNTANYFQTIDYKLGNGTEVIPNYVDINEFSNKGDKRDKENNKIVIIYPRRLCEPRGMYMVLNILDKLLAEYTNVEVHFIGKGFKKDTDKINEKIKKYGNDKVKMYHLSPEMMHTVYEKADITLIPTLYSEGTSLSCLEAMASQNAVIATRIGGLTDLIINNYNGKLIEPNETELYKAIKEFIDNKDLKNKCQRNARLIAKEFNKDMWKEKWKNVIKQISNPIEEESTIIEYKKVKIKIEKQEDMNTMQMKKFIYNKLVNNYIIYLETNNILDYRKSKGRIQYIDSKDEIYFKYNEEYCIEDIVKL